MACTLPGFGKQNATVPVLGRYKRRPFTGKRHFQAGFDERRRTDRPARAVRPTTKVAIRAER
jgi:hypothetical protein